MIYSIWWRKFEINVQQSCTKKIHNTFSKTNKYSMYLYVICNSIRLIFTSWFGNSTPLVKTTTKFLRWKKDNKFQFHYFLGREVGVIKLKWDVIYQACLLAAGRRGWFCRRGEKSQHCRWSGGHSRPPPSWKFYTCTRFSGLAIVQTNVLREFSARSHLQKNRLLKKYSDVNNAAKKSININFD